MFHKSHNYAENYNVTTENLGKPVHILPLWAQMTHWNISKLGHNCFREWLVTCLALSYYLTNAGSFIIGDNFSLIWLYIISFSYKKINLKTSTKWCLFCLGLHVLRDILCSCSCSWTPIPPITMIIPFHQVIPVAYIFPGRPSQIARSMGPTCHPPGSCRPQVGPMLAPWNLLSGIRCTLSLNTSLPSRPPNNGKLSLNI